MTDYKGLTVKIGADTTSLTKALRNAKKEASGVATDLRAVEKALRLDPHNVALLAQKQADYRKQIKACAAELRVLKQAEQQIGKDNMSSEQWTKLQADIVKAQTSMRSLLGAMEDVKRNTAFAKYGAQIDKANGKINEQKALLEQVNSSLRLAPRNVELHRAKQVALSEAIAQTKTKLDAMRAATSTLTEADLGKEKWVALQHEILQTETALKGYKREVSQALIDQGVATSALGRLGVGLQTAGARYEGLGRGMEMLGRGLAYTLTPAIIAAGAGTVMAATKIDTALTGVRKTVDGTEEDYQRLKSAALEFSQTNAVDADAILDIQALGAQLGFAIGELDEFGQVVSGLDIATNMEADTAATEMAQFANITKLAHSEIRNYGSSIVGLGNNFATTESDISAMAMRIAAAGTQIGLSQADILGLATALSSLGMEAEAGGSAMSTVMSRIDMAVATNGGTLKEWARLAGQTAGEFADTWRTKPVDALTAVMDGMSKAAGAGENMNVILGGLEVTQLRQVDSLKRMAGNSELVARAVATANDEWVQNSALQKEVDNRNQSLAAQFQLIKNRVIAIADKVGGPLASALLDALDAAEPLFAALASGAQTFADMDKDQQRLVLTLAAVAAGFGPVVGVTGNVITNFSSMGSVLKSLAEFFARVDVRTKASSAQMGVLAQSTGKAEMATKKHTAAVKLSSVAMGFAKTAAAGLAGVLAMAIIGGLIAQWNDYREALNDAKAATDGMRDAVNAAKADYSAAAPEAQDYASSLDQVHDKTRELTKNQAELASSIKSTWEEIGANSAVVDSCADTIERLSNKYDENGNRVALSANEQMELQTAVATLNETCGTTYKVIDAQNGILSESTATILANADAWEANAKAQAAQEALTDLYRTQIENKRQLAEVNKQIADSEENIGIKIGDTRLAIGPEYDAYRDLINQRKTLEEANTDAASAEEFFKGELQASQQAAQQASESVDTLSGDLNEMGDATQQAAQAVNEEVQKVADEITELLSHDATFAQMLTDSGYSVDALAEKMYNAGISVSDLSRSIEDYAAKSGNAFETIQLKSGISLDQMLANLQENNRITSEWSSNISALYARAGDESQRGFIQYIAGMGPEYAPIVQALVDDSGDMLATLASEWASATKAGKDAALAQTGLFADGAPQDMQQAVDGSVSALNGGVPGVGQAADGLANAATNATGRVVEELPENAEEASQGYADSLAKGEATAKANAEAMANTSKAMNMYADLAFVWGSHMSHNFANGIRSGHAEAAAAASAIAQTVKNILGHTKPKEGPLKSGEWIYGYHAAVNFSEGLASGANLAKESASGVASGAKDGLTDAERELQAYINEMVRLYERRAPEVKEASQLLTDAMWGTIYPKAMAREYVRPVTGAVYDSMKVIENAGYTLDSYMKKNEEYAKKKAEWNKKLADPKVTDSTRESFEEWRVEYEEWLSLNARLTASFDDMQRYAGLYKMKDDLISGMDTAETWSDVMGKLSNKAGVAFSKNFVERVSKGGDEYLAALAQVADGTEEEIQAVVDQFDDLALAEKEQELAQRSLYINSMQKLQMKKPKEWMLDFRETCLDVKEALNGNTGLMSAFNASGSAVVDFSLDLESLDVTMADFTSAMDGYVSKVSNGFTQLTKHGQTGLADWSTNLKLNISEAQQYADNLEKVFSNIDPSINADAFRKAVYEGGYEQWGMVIADMASASSEQVAKAIELYNESVAEAQKSAIEQFEALAPGAELM